MSRGDDRAPWRVSIDTGGTFTDCVARDPAGGLHRVKVLSTGLLRGRVIGHSDGNRLTVEQHWEVPPPALEGYQLTLASGQTACVQRCSDALDQIWLDRPLPRPPVPGPFELGTGEPAAVVAARLVTATPAGRPLPRLAMRLGTTRGTNALLERRGAPTALLVSAGFADLLEIGDQRRPDLFALQIRKPAPLYRAVLEVDERIAADGTVLRPLQLAGLRVRAEALLRDGITVAAVALVNSYRNPTHEQALARWLTGLGFTHVSCSADLSPLIEILPRAETALVNAYLSPQVGDFLASVAGGTGVDLQRHSSDDASTLLLMTSAGGLLPAASYRPKDSLLSGPAGGVVGAAFAGQRSGFSRVISFDMGGTSTDVARWDGAFDYRYDQRVGDVRLAASVLAIETVASGGGSICDYRHGELCVGPDSAGANPGPACYGAGGPLTLTDVNLLLGRLDADHFGLPVDREAARRRLVQLSDALAEAGPRPDEDRLLEGLIAIANERMADAIRRVSLRRGYQPADHALVAFGGAGPQHACGVAQLLGIDTVVVPSDAGLLSAVGIAGAPLERIVERQLLVTLTPARLPAIRREMAALCETARSAVIAAGVARDNVSIRHRLLQLRFLGQDATLDVEYKEHADLAQAFEQRHLQRFGHRPTARAIEVVSARVIASTEPLVPRRDPPALPRPATAAREIRARLDGRWLSVPCYDAASLAPGARLQSPAVVLGPHSTAVIEPGWRAEIDPAGSLVMRQTAAIAPQWTADAQRPEAVRLELFSNRLGTIAEEMGEVLRRTALSTNVKERLDFSCALLDAEGRLVVNAPHIPVHLGSLGLCVRQVIRVLPLSPGDVAVTNHPAHGGSHLPDITVITPAFLDGDLLGYVASRAHHAEIGGCRPGSMPPQARCLAEEGVVIPPSFLVRDGEPRFDAIAELLGRGPWPSRAVGDNLADLRAAVAANHRGVRALRELAAATGVETVTAAMRQLRRRAEREIRHALAQLPDARHSHRSELDDGSPLSVSVEIKGDRARIDFSGSAAVHPGNLNATPAIVHGAVIYVLRLLIAHPLPLNEGLTDAVEISIPPGLLAPPFAEDPARAPAVVGGNVETSQRLVDILLQALGLAACSQGTMNNLLFGTEDFGYYETICGGSGAGPGFAGAHAVQTHMTNTKITDVEVLEQRYPVRVERFRRRCGSGGAGRHPGGDGVVRELVFLRPLALSLLSQRRGRGPAGMAGGGRGRPGAQYLVRRGQRIALPGIAACEVIAGDRLVIETPGGGGYGFPP